MKTSTTMLLTGGALLAMYLYRLYKVKQAASGLVTKFLGVKDVTLKGNSAIFTLVLQTENPSNTAILVDKTWGTISDYRNKSFASFSTQPYTVAKGVSQIAINFIVSYDAFKKMSIDMLLDKAASIVTISYSTKLKEGVTQTQRQQIDLKKVLSI